MKYIKNICHIKIKRAGLGSTFISQLVGDVKIAQNFDGHYLKLLG